MTSPVDLTNLREITGGDTELERKLFETFLQSAEECINGLKQSRQSEDDQKWRHEAHAFKGIAMNLGAMRLADICKDAQNRFMDDPDEKQALLSQMSDELNLVRTYLTNEMAHAAT